MKHEYYLPKDDSGKALWLHNFWLKLVTYAAALGITPAQLASVQADSDYFSEVVLALTTFVEYFKTLTTYKNTLRDGSEVPIGGFPTPPALPTNPAVAAGVFDRTTELVRNLKSNPALTQAMAEDLGIIGAEIDPDFDTIKPEPKVVLKNSHAYVKWPRKHTDAADVYADHGDGAGFTLQGRIMKAHYLDPTMPPAGQSKVYWYKIRYVVNDEVVGEESDPVSETVTGQ